MEFLDDEQQQRQTRFMTTPSRCSTAHAAGWRQHMIGA